MRAVWLDGFGGPEVLVVRETPTPEPQPGQVLIKVSAAVVNFVDTLVRADRMSWPGNRPSLPFIPGNGVGGVVVEVGAAVPASHLGQRVVAGTGGSGGYAEFVAVPVAELISVPPNLDMVQATALLADGRTALGLADAASVRDGQSVLVLAAAGGVGSLLVQVCKSRSAHVTGGAGGPDKTALVWRLGVDAIDYNVPGWSQGVAFDVVFDGVGGDIGGSALAALRPGGRFVQFGLSSGRPTEMSRTDVVHTGFEVLREIGSRSKDLTRAALELGASGRLTATVGQTFPLERAPAAHAAVESRATIGRTLLVP